MTFDAGSPIWESHRMPPSATARFDVLSGLVGPSLALQQVETIQQFLSSYPFMAELFINVHLPALPADTISGYRQFFDACLALRFGHTRAVPRMRLFLPLCEVSEFVLTRFDEMNAKSDALEIVVVVDSRHFAIGRAGLTEPLLSLSSRLDEKSIVHSVLLHVDGGNVDLPSTIFLLRALSASRPPASGMKLFFEYSFRGDLTDKTRAAFYRDLFQYLVYLVPHFDDGSRAPCGYMGVIRTQLRLGPFLSGALSAKYSSQLWCSPHRSMCFTLGADGSVRTCPFASMPAGCRHHGAAAESQLCRDAFRQCAADTDILARLGSDAADVNLLTRMEDYALD